MDKIFIFQERNSNTWRIRISAGKEEYLRSIENFTEINGYNHIKENICEWKDYCKNDANKSFELDEKFNFNNKRIDFIFDLLDGKSEYNIYLNDKTLTGGTKNGLIKKKYTFSNHFNYVLKELIEDMKNNNLEYEES